MSVELYLTYVAACFIITIIPGPTVTLIVANSLTHGTRAGLLNVAGTQLGLGLMMMVLVVGLSSIIATMGIWFDWLRLAGAAYLVWIGWKLLRSSGGFAQLGNTPAPRGGFFLQGFLVLLGNPKALLWFGASTPAVTLWGRWCCSALRRWRRQPFPMAVTPFSRAVPGSSCHATACRRCHGSVASA